jgi:glutamate synthase (NADPH/NADH) large chain
MRGEPVREKFIIRNTDRTTGALLSNEISKKYKGKGLPEDTIRFHFKGSAGQSFAAFVRRASPSSLKEKQTTISEKDCRVENLSFILIRKHIQTEDNIIIGNVAFYGRLQEKHT